MHSPLFISLMTLAVLKSLPSNASPVDLPTKQLVRSLEERAGLAAAANIPNMGVGPASLPDDTANGLGEYEGDPLRKARSKRAFGRQGLAMGPHKTTNDDSNNVESRSVDGKAKRRAAIAKLKTASKAAKRSVFNGSPHVMPLQPLRKRDNGASEGLHPLMYYQQHVVGSDPPFFLC